MDNGRIDHLVMTAPSLEAGADTLRETLGVEPAGGGKHPAMGTHNLLLKLGESLYLEMIAIDPAVPAPRRPRWFGLDELTSSDPPALAAWVVRTDDIHAARAACQESLGTIVPMERDTLRWLITIPDDGVPVLGGAAPALIQWLAGPHPAASLADLGLSLVELAIIHPEPARILRMLNDLGMEGPWRVQAGKPGADARLKATIGTAAGLRYL